jgi:transposase
VPGIEKTESAAKKKTLHATERDTEANQKARENYKIDITQVKPEDLVFLDESGVNIAMTRLYGRAPKGQRAFGSVPKNWDKNVTILGAMSLSGLIATMSIQSATDTPVFQTFVERVLIPQLWPGAVVVMDNLAVHKVKRVREAIEAAGARVVYLPSYSPDLNPIENCWSKLKTYLRKRGTRTYEALDNALSEAIEEISSKDAIGWFKHCGYCIPCD